MVRLYLAVGVTCLLSAAIIIAAKVIGAALMASAYRFNAADPASLSFVHGFLGYAYLEYFLLVPALLFILLGAHEAAAPGGRDRPANREQAGG